MDYKAGDELNIMTNPPYYYKGKVIKVEGQKIVLQDNEGWQMGFDFSKHNNEVERISY
jgi:hypothetical protein